MNTKIHRTESEENNIYLAEVTIVFTEKATKEYIKRTGIKEFITKRKLQIIYSDRNKNLAYERCSAQLDLNEKESFKIESIKKIKHIGYANC